MNPRTGAGAIFRNSMTWRFPHEGGAARPIQGLRFSKDEATNPKEPAPRKAVARGLGRVSGLETPLEGRRVHEWGKGSQCLEELEKVFE